VVLYAPGGKMDQIRETQEKLDRLDEKRAELSKQKLEAIQAVPIACIACKQYTSLGDWIFIQKLWWVPPSGCTEGAYWKNHQTHTCDLRCPQCSYENYIYNHPQKAKIVELVDHHGFYEKKIFKNVEERFEK
jgi:hypothetical protein